MKHSSASWLLLFSHWVISNSSWPRRLQHPRPPCPAPPPGVCPSSCPEHRWCHPAVSSSDALFCSAFNLSQHQGLFQCVGSSRQLAKILELQHQSFQWVFRVDFLYDWLVWSPCSPRDSQESFPEPQFESINSSGLCLLYGPALTTIRDHWEDQSLDYTDLSPQHTVEVCHSFRTKNFSLSNLKHMVQLTALPLSPSWARQTYLLKPRDMIRSTQSLTGIHSDSLVKNPPAMQETWVRFPGGEEPWEKEMVTHSSILAWEILHTEEPGGLQSMRLQKSWTYKSHLLAVWSWISYLSFLCSSFFICWEWAISSVPEDYGKDKLRYLAHKETAKISYSSYCFLAVKLENYGSTIEYFAMRYFLLLLLWSLTLVQLLSCYGISFEFQWTLRFQRVPMCQIFTVKCMLAHK